MEFVSLGDLVYFGITTHSPSGIADLVNLDETPRYFMYKNASDTIVLQGNFILRDGLKGTYHASGTISTGNGFSTGDYVEVHASGKYNAVVNRDIIKTFVIDDTYNANLVKISGVDAGSSNYINDKVWQANLTQYTGNNTAGSGLNKIIADVYFANIKFVKDGTVPRDEYTIHWFKNSQQVGHSGVTNPALSVFRTNIGTALISNAVLNYNNEFNGSIRYNEPTNLATSGEPYLAVTSGVIDGAVRVWSNLVGLDYL